MSLRRITISVPAEIAEKAQRAAASGRAESVSAYFVELAAREPDWAAADEVLATMIEEAGGLSNDATSWADAVLAEQERTGAA